MSRALAALALSAALPVAAQGPAQAPLPADVVATIRGTYGDGEMHYLDRVVDLNGDGRPEIVV
jgi:hypothetical protein